MGTVWQMQRKTLWLQTIQILCGSKELCYFVPSLYTVYDNILSTIYQLKQQQ